jgi:hypothetical protein
MHVLFPGKTSMRSVIGRLAVIALITLGIAVFAGGGSDDASGSRKPTASELHQLSNAAHSYSTFWARRLGSSVVVSEIAGERYDVALKRLRRHGLEMQGRFPGTLGNPSLPGRCIIVSTQAPRTGARLPRGSLVTGVMGLCKDSIPRLARKHEGWMDR